MQRGRSCFFSRVFLNAHKGRQLQRLSGCQLVFGILETAGVAINKPEP